jgi:hypothetical protein
MANVSVPSQPEWIGAKEWEALTSLSSRLFWQLIKEGKLTAYRPCKKRTIVRRAEVIEFLESTKEVAL